MLYVFFLTKEWQITSSQRSWSYSNSKFLIGVKSEFPKTDKKTEISI